MTTNRSGVPTPEHNPDANKAGLIMMALFGLGCLIFVCFGGVAMGFSAVNNSESASVQLSYFILSPMAGAIIGLITSVITHFTIKHSVIAKIVIPLVVAFFTVPCVLGCIFGFYKAIWPSL